MHVVLLEHGEVSLVRLRPVWMTNHLPSVLWHCWLGHQTCKNCRPYNLYCVGADVKPCSINQSIPLYPKQANDCTFRKETVERVIVLSHNAVWLGHLTTFQAVKCVNMACSYLLPTLCTDIRQN